MNAEMKGVMERRCCLRYVVYDDVDSRYRWWYGSRCQEEGERREAAVADGVEGDEDVVGRMCTMDTSAVEMVACPVSDRTTREDSGNRGRRWGDRWGNRDCGS